MGGGSAFLHGDIFIQVSDSSCVGRCVAQSVDRLSLSANEVRIATSCVLESSGMFGSEEISCPKKFLVVSVLLLSLPSFPFFVFFYGHSTGHHRRRKRL
jgi:hypothetical protein